MESGVLHLGKAIHALNENNFSTATGRFIRVAEVIQEASIRLNLEDGGEAARSLEKLYRWWTAEIMEAARLKDTARLAGVARGMGEIRQAWEQLHLQKVKADHTGAFSFQDQVG